MNILSLRRWCVALVSIGLLSPILAPAAHGAMVGTEQALALDGRGAYLDAARVALARSDVRESMLAMGVDPSVVDARLGSLTNAELQLLASRIGEAPAGGDVLAIIGIVFLVLLLLEYTGTIDIFKNVP